MSKKIPPPGESVRTTGIITDVGTFTRVNPNVFYETVVTDERFATSGIMTNDLVPLAGPLMQLHVRLEHRLRSETRITVNLGAVVSFFSIVALFVMQKAASTKEHFPAPLTVTRVTFEVGQSGHTWSSVRRLCI